jgi:hypothetical protein
VSCGFGYNATLNDQVEWMPLAIVVVIGLSITSLFVVPMTDRIDGEPLALFCVGIAFGAIRLRNRKPKPGPPTASA